jgi:hypothetical protein
MSKGRGVTFLFIAFAFSGCVGSQATVSTVERWALVEQVKSKARSQSNTVCRLPKGEVLSPRLIEMIENVQQVDIISVEEISHQRFEFIFAKNTDRFALEILLNRGLCVEFEAWQIVD